MSDGPDMLALNSEVMTPERGRKCSKGLPVMNAGAGANARRPGAGGARSRHQQLPPADRRPRERRAADCASWIPFPASCGWAKGWRRPACCRDAAIERTIAALEDLRRAHPRQRRRARARHRHPGLPAAPRNADVLLARARDEAGIELRSSAPRRRPAGGAGLRAADRSAIRRRADLRHRRRLDRGDLAAPRCRVARANVTASLPCRGRGDPGRELRRPPRPAAPAIERMRAAMIAPLSCRCAREMDAMARSIPQRIICWAPPARSRPGGHRAWAAALQSRPGGWQLARYRAYAARWSTGLSSWI